MVEYIEREQAISALMQDCPELTIYTRDEAVSCIESIPAADVAPVVHGHWIKTSLMFASSPTGRHGNVHACSNCGEQSGIGFKTPYCAICGAKMDEEGTNNDT